MTVTIGDRVWCDVATSEEEPAVYPGTVIRFARDLVVVKVRTGSGLQVDVAVPSTALRVRTEGS